MLSYPLDLSFKIATIGTRVHAARDPSRGASAHGLVSPVLTIDAYACRSVGRRRERKVRSVVRI